ncbi:MAG: OmpA family protein, partial [Pseudomonadales bacterium]
IVSYVEADTDIKQLYVDGYNDDLRGGAYNSQLSQKRAEAVAAYLVDKGISAEQVTTRFHGERFPVASNKTAEGRSTNRRVTIRLDKLGAAISQR